MSSIDFTTYCTKCSQPLDADVSVRNTGVDVYVEACTNCLQEAELDGIQKGKDIAESEAAQ